MSLVSNRNVSSLLCLEKPFSTVSHLPEGIVSVTEGSGVLPVCAKLCTWNKFVSFHSFSYVGMVVKRGRGKECSIFHVEF